MATEFPTSDYDKSYGNNCLIRAIATALDTSYDEVMEYFLESAKRTRSASAVEKAGAYIVDWYPMVRELGFVKMPEANFTTESTRTTVGIGYGRYIPVNTTPRKVKMTLNRLLKSGVVSKGTYIIETSDHALCIIDGEIINDWTAKRKSPKHKVINIWEMV